MHVVDKYATWKMLTFSWLELSALKLIDRSDFLTRKPMVYEFLKLSEV